MEASGAADLSDGIVVQAQLLGRVLGLRVLRVDGTVLVAPARPVVRGPDAQPPVRVTGPPSGRASWPPGAELVEAARLLDELS